MARSQLLAGVARVVITPPVGIRMCGDTVPERGSEGIERGLTAMAAMPQQPARLGTGKGSAIIGVNRREKLPDGQIILGQNPAGAVDREVGVLRVDHLDGKPLATVMIAACHTVVLGPKTYLLSPD